MSPPSRTMSTARRMSRGWGLTGWTERYSAIARGSCRGSQLLPDGRQCAGYLDRVADIGHTLARRMEIRSRRQRESELAREAYLCGGTEAPLGIDLDGVAAGLVKRLEQRSASCAAKAVTIGMREYCEATGKMDQFDYSIQFGPDRRHVRLAGRCPGRGEMRRWNYARIYVRPEIARNGCGPARPVRARDAARPPGCRQCRARRVAPQYAPPAYRGDCGSRRVLRRGAAIADRCPAREHAASGRSTWLKFPRRRPVECPPRRRQLGFGDAAGFVVVCQGEHVYAPCGGPAHQFGRREHPIGIRGVGMQIDTQQEGVADEGEHAS